MTQSNTPCLSSCGKSGGAHKGGPLPPAGGSFGSAPFGTKLRLARDMEIPSRMAALTTKAPKKIKAGTSMKLLAVCKFVVKAKL